MPLRRMLPFILINVVVSATVFVLLLYWWDSREADDISATPTVQVEQMAPTPVLVGGVTSEAPAGGEEVDNDVSEEEEEDTGNGPTTHIVQAGETLGVISQQYDVPVEDIAAANNIVNINAISVGQELVIPIGGLPTETPPPTVAPTNTPSPTVTSTVAPVDETPQVEITEVIGAGELTDEAVRISNGGSQPLSLQGWQLEDESGTVYTFGGVTIFGSSNAGAPSILVHTEAGQNSSSDLYWGLENAIWQSGEVVTLRDDQGDVQATYEIP